MRVELGANETAKVTLRTHDEGSIRVRVESLEGFDPETFSVIAKMEGNALLQGRLEGDAFVFQPLPLGRYDVFYDSDPAGTAQHVELNRDGQGVELTLALPALHRLSGRVVDNGGQGIPEVWVRAVREQTAGFSRPTEAVLTDVEGNFFLGGLVPGRYTLDVAGPLAEGHLPGVASDSKGVVVRAESFGSLAGTLRNAAGTSIDDFVLSYNRENGDSQGEVSGARGSWSLPSLPAGTYQLSARASAGSASRVVHLPAGGKVSVALQLAATGMPEERALLESMRGSDESSALEAASQPVLANSAN